MKKEDFIKAFSELSPADQAAVRDEILVTAKETEEAAACCTGPMKAHLTDMMEKMAASENPMAMCNEMMRMCQDKMQAMHK